MAKRTEKRSFRVGDSCSIAGSYMNAKGEYVKGSSLYTDGIIISLSDSKAVVLVQSTYNIPHELTLPLEVLENNDYVLDDDE